MFFRIKRSTQLKKLMNAYCDRQSVDMSAIAFLFDGRRLRPEQTPDEVCAITFRNSSTKKSLQVSESSLVATVSARDGRWR